MKLRLILYRLLFFGLPYFAFGAGYFWNTRLFAMDPFEAIVVSAIIAIGLSNLQTYSALKN
ncbi:MAG: hypothetical protein IPM21_17980 [Acidobacteria bacterium]|nr:hypothetical protein [Acidobacteriota bacterium]